MFPFSTSLHSYFPSHSLSHYVQNGSTPIHRIQHSLQISNQVWIYHTNFDKLTERMWHVCHCYFDLLFSTWFSCRWRDMLTSLVLPLIFHMFCTYATFMLFFFFLSPSLCVLLSQKHNIRYGFFILLWSSNEFFILHSFTSVLIRCYNFTCKIFPICISVFIKTNVTKAYKVVLQQYHNLIIVREKLFWGIFNFSIKSNCCAWVENGCCFIVNEEKKVAIASMKVEN